MHRILFLIALILGMPALAAEPVPEYSMKATYLYNFALYTEWPEDTGNTLNLCLLGGERFGGAINQIQGKLVNQRRLNVYQVSGPKAVQGCQMVFIGEQESQYAQRMINSLADTPVLTVTDGFVPLNSGVIVSMVVEERKIAFNINASAARRAKLNISSKLLRLARNVY
jgi:hypothetical protein